MESHGYQQPVQHAIYKGTHGSRADDPLTDGLYHRLTVSPDAPEQQRQENRRHCRHDRHETGAPKEAQEFRQLDLMKAVVKPACLQTSHDARQDAHIQAFINSPQSSCQHQIADSPRESCCPAAILGNANRNADGENQGKIVKDCAAPLGNEGDVQHIRRPKAQEQRRCRQHGNGQHQCLADELQFLEQLSHMINPSKNNTFCFLNISFITFIISTLLRHVTYVKF